MKKKLFSYLTTLVLVFSFIGSVPLINVSAVSMKASENGISLIKELEGFREKAYKALSTETYYTIGYGHYGSDVYAGMTITQSEAETLLRNDLVKYEGYVNTFLNKYSITIKQNQFDALVSFTYNLGNVWVSTPEFKLKTYLINGVNNYSDTEITTAFTNWCKSGGNVIQGLITRRKREAEMFLGGSPILPGEIDNSYDVPANMKATHKFNTYDEYGNVESDHYVALNDDCYVQEVYTNGFIKLQYPVGSSKRWAYAKYSDMPVPKKGTPINQNIDNRYQTPYEIQPRSATSLTLVYNEYGQAYDTSTRNIAPGDWCTIHEVYTSGFCKVTYPTSKGTHTEYAKIADFDVPLKGDLKFYASTNSVTVSLSNNESKVVTFTTENCYDTVYMNFSGSNITNISWGDWDSSGTSVPMTIKGNSVGTETITVKLINSDTNNILASVQVTITVTCDHKWSDWSTTKKATCTADGSKTRQCSVCGKTETAVIEKTGHKYRTISGTGIITYKCENCGYSYTEKAMPVDIKCNDVAACPGETINVDIYADTHGAKYRTIELRLNYDETKLKIKDMYSTELSNKSGDLTFNSNAGVMIFSDAYSESGVSNNPDKPLLTVEFEILKTATPGKCDIKLTGTNGSADVSFGVEDALNNIVSHKIGTIILEDAITINCNHKYNSKAIAPTCTEKGYTLHTCSVCGDSYKDTYVNATGHKWSDWATTKNATCTADGSKTRQCSVCGKTETAVIEKTGHKYDSKVIAPTYTEKGYDLHVCVYCNDYYTDNFVEKERGDMNDDCIITVADLVILQKYLTLKHNLTEEQFIGADMNNDGTINVFDMIIAKRKVLNN